MKRIVLLFALVASVLSASAQLTKQINVGADEIVTLWDNSTAKYSNHMDKEEKVISGRKFYNTSSADLYIFHPEKKNDTGVSIVIYPGGSYRYVGFSTHFVNWCKENGITAAMLKYRVPNYGHNQATLEDATGAVEYMRANAERLGIDPTKVGVAGCSAGGHLATWVSNAMPDGEKPAFAIPHYGWFNLENSHSTSEFKALIQLLGKKYTLQDVRDLSTYRMVSATTPPTLLLLCHDDAVVSSEDAVNYYEALVRHGVKASMHIFPFGGHSIGKHTTECYSLILDWLRYLGMINEDK